MMDNYSLRRYRRRWRVERLFAWLHHFRRLVIRWEYHVENFLACFVSVACKSCSGIYETSPSGLLATKLRLKTFQSIGRSHVAAPPPRHKPASTRPARRLPLHRRASISNPVPRSED